MQSLLEGVNLTDFIILKNYVFFMDGGSLYLFLADASGTEFSVMFRQTVISYNYPENATPGSLLFNELEVPTRSADEVIILTALKKLKTNDAEALKFIAERIEFVESEDYLIITASRNNL